MTDEEKLEKYAKCVQRNLARLEVTFREIKSDIALMQQDLESLLQDLKLVQNDGDPKIGEGMDRYWEEVTKPENS